MKKIIFILLLIISLFYIDKVYADLSCSDAITLTETSMADRAYLYAYLPVCDERKFTGYVSLSTIHKRVLDAAGIDKYDADSVSGSGDLEEKYVTLSIDDKTKIESTRVLCGDPAAKLEVVVGYTYQVRYDATAYECTKKRFLDGYKECMKLCLLEKKMDKNSTCSCTNYVEEYKDTCYKCPNGGNLTDWGNAKICVITESGSTEPMKIDKDSSVSYVEQWTICNRERVNDERGEPHGRCIVFATYDFLCPVYDCKKSGSKPYNLCTPSFQEKTSGERVYCVNPGLFFSKTLSSTAEYQTDVNFNVKDCESSYSTVDCGYANILIEGAKYSLPDKVIEFALRLWGVHTNQAGFNKLGISHKAGTDCKTNLHYTAIKNVYKETYKYFSKYLLANLRFRDSINPVLTETSDRSAFDIGCNSSLLGVACGSTIQYKQGMALLTNTILGNSTMQEDLNSLYGGGISEDVDNADLITDENGDQYIQIYFDNIEQITKEVKQKIDCTKLDDMVNNRIITSEQKKQIEPFFKVTAGLVDEDGRELTEYSESKRTPVYCYKNFCRVKIKDSFAICDYEKRHNKRVKVRLKYTKSDTSNVVKKYIACANPDESQIMFSIDEGSSDNNRLNTPVEEEFEIVNVKCHGTCDDYNLRTNIKDTCSDDKTNYDSAFVSSIKDPSLKCILNMDNPSIKNKYNYSNTFEVSNRFCKVYCSDEVVYHVADKVRSISGRKFYYDIEGTLRTDKNIVYKFSNIVEEKRTCVSEIYYNNEFTENINWQKIYGLGKDARGNSDGITDEEIKGIKNWKTLFTVLLKKSESEGGRTENLSKILYDLYNCNLYTDDEIKDLGIKKAENDKSANIKETIIKMFSKENNYGIGTDENCVMNSTTNTCITMNNISYDFGPNPDGKVMSMKSKVNNDNTLSNLIYCKSSDNCFEYDPNHKENEYNYPTSGNSDIEPLRNVVGIDIVRDNSVANVFASDDLKVPTNDYAMFTVSTEVDFYNSSRFEILPNGNTIKAGTGKSGEKHLKLESFAFPVSKVAYNLSVCEPRDFLTTEGYRRCLITQKYNKISTYFRNNYRDEFYSAINNANEYKCYIDVEVPFTEEGSRGRTLYRNVDTASIFPNSKDGYTKKANSNWATAIGKKATDLIEASSSKLKVSNDYLEYRIVLNPVQINNIKEYNKQNESYINEEPIEKTCKIVDDTYQNCISPFLEELRRNNQYGSLDKFYRIGGEVKERIDKQ